MLITGTMQCSEGQSRDSRRHRVIPGDVAQVGVGGETAAGPDTSAQPLPVSHVEACVASANEKDQWDYALPGQPRQSVDEAPVLRVVGQRQAVPRRRVVHALHEFTDSAQKVVDLLRWDCEPLPYSQCPLGAVWLGPPVDRGRVGRRGRLRPVRSARCLWTPRAVRGRRWVAPTTRVLAAEMARWVGGAGLCGTAGRLQAEVFGR